MYIEILKIGLIVFVFVKLGEVGNIFSWYQKLIDPLPEWIWKPLGGCVKCLSGQVGFWFYLIKYFHNYKFIDHLFFAASTIFLSVIIDFIWDNLE